MDWIRVYMWLAVCLSYTHSQSFESRVKLFEELKTRTYPMFRPVKNQSQPIVVASLIDLQTIVDFTEVKETIYLSANMYVYWFDETFVWVPEENDDVTSLDVSISDIWVPHLIQANTNDEAKTFSQPWYTVNVRYDGLVNFIPHIMFVSECNVDMSFYPIDVQVCTLIIVAKNYGAGQIIMHPLSPEVLLSFFRPSAEWDLVATSVYTQLDGYVLAVDIAIQRKPQFVVVNVLLPVALMSFLNILVYLIPSESGEKISFCLTVVLAFAVFLTLVSENLPKNAIPMAIYSYYLVTVLNNSILITLATIWSMRLYHRNPKEKIGPFWRYLTRFMLCRSQKGLFTSMFRRSAIINLEKKQAPFFTRVSRKIQPDCTSVVEENDDENETNLKETDNNEPAEYQTVASEDLDWTDVSRAVDRLLLCAFFLLTVIITVTGMLWIYVSAARRYDEVLMEAQNKVVQADGDDGTD